MATRILRFLPTTTPSIAMKFPWTAPTARDIVDEVDALSHNQRFRRMIELGRQSAQNHQLAQALQTLADSEAHYERMLALMAASGSQDAGVVASFLSADSYRRRGAEADA
jgi:hypothetical protein